MCWNHVLSGINLPTALRQMKYFLLRIKESARHRGATTPRHLLWITSYSIHVGPLSDDVGNKVTALYPEVKANIESYQRTFSDRIAQYGEKSNEVAQITNAIEEEKHRLLEPYLTLRILDPAMGSGHFSSAQRISSVWLWLLTLTC